MSDTVDDWRALRAYNTERKAALGVDCPGCRKVQPKRTPTRLLPGQRCRVCGYVDRREQRIDVRSGPEEMHTESPIHFNHEGTDHA